MTCLARHLPSAEPEASPLRASGLSRSCVAAQVGPRCWIAPARGCALAVTRHTPARCDADEPVGEAAARAYGHLEHRGRLVTPTRYPGRPGEPKDEDEPDWAGLAGGRTWEEPRSWGGVE